jgi:hypothetical protein
VPRAALTDLSVKRIPVPEKGTVTHWDTMKGFGVRVSAGGSKTFIVLIGPGRRQSIGRYPLISLSDARAEAKRILAEKTLGKVRPTHAAFEDVKEQFLAHCTRSNRPETVKSYRRHLNRHYPFGRKSVGDIGPRDILRNLAKLDDTPSEKHHAYVVGSRFFRWCIGQHFIDRSPMENLAIANTSRPRDRTFDRDELSELLSPKNSSGAAGVAQAVDRA